MRFVVFFLFVFLVDQASGTTYKCNVNASCGCSVSSTVLTRIIGGENAVDRSWSWAVSLRVDKSHICGGSILSPLFIITAAHCAAAITRLSTATILAGSITLEPPSSNTFYQIRSISNMYSHPNYNSMTYENDLALLRLSTPLNMTNGYIKPICLPTGTNPEPSDDIEMIAAGWGVTSTTDYTPASNLQQVTVKSIKSSSDECKRVIENSQLQFCAGLLAGGKDTCQGDSGGPLMTLVNDLWQLHGITSYGYDCALPGYPGIYTRISYYVSWIKSIMQTNELTTTITKTPVPSTTTTKKPTTSIKTERITTTTKKPTTSATTERITTTIKKIITSLTTERITTTTKKPITSITTTTKQKPIETSATSTSSKKPVVVTTIATTQKPIVTTTMNKQTIRQNSTRSFLQ